MPVTSIGGAPARLASGNIPTANATVFTAQVPTILRDFIYSTSTSGTCALGINGSTVPAQILPTISGTVSTMSVWALNVPLNVGDTVQLIGSVTTQNYTLTGEIAGQGAA